MSTAVQNYLVGDTYPPENHILRDLAIEIQTDNTGQASIQAPVTPHVCTQSGVLYAGVLATLVDVVGGILAVQAISPDWLSTANMSLITTGDITSGNVSGQGRVLRCGRTSVVVEVDLFNEIENPAESTISAGLALITYSRLPGNQRELQIKSDGSRNQAVHFALGGSPLNQPLADKVGIHILDPAGGKLGLNMTTCVRNSLNSLQGGIIAFLADLAGQLALSTTHGRDWQTRDLTIHYMTPGIKGPFETTSEILRADNHGAVMRIKVHDRGDKDRLMAVIFTSCVRMNL